MKKNTVRRTLSSLATGTLVCVLAGFSVNTYACDACKTKTASEASANEQSAPAAPATCTDCNCKEGESAASGTCQKD